ncbi:MAG: hypothetical protein Q8K85_22260 [Hyphomicrobium sp.]|nr:hypothetical protein [Hyphomicrobium sp.]
MERRRLFPATLHTLAARGYLAEAAEYEAQIAATRDKKRRDLLASRRDQKWRNADFHSRLALQM